MKSTLAALAAILIAPALHAGDLDLYLVASTLYPQAASHDGSVDPRTGFQLGSTVTRGGGLPQLGLGAATTLLSPGNWRVGAGVEYTASTSSTSMGINYLAFQGLSQNSATTAGTLKTSSINPALSLVYVSSGAGEYGVSYEQHLTRLSYDLTSNIVQIADTTPASVPSSLSKNYSDPFLALHATFVQRYRTHGFFARVSYGVNLASIKSLSSLTASDYLSTSTSLLDLARPKQEVKLALGARF